MVEDNPQDLVHDVVAEAVFGGHPLGRPVIGRAEVISSVGAPRARLVPPRCVRRRQHRRRRGRERRARPAVAACSPSGCRETPPSSMRPRKPLAAPPVARPPLPAQGDRAVPRLPRRARPLAARRAALRRLAARRDPRRLGLVAALPGDPREARDGLRRLQLRLAVLRHGPDRALHRHARGEPRRVPRDRGARAGGRGRRATCGRASSSGPRRT